MRIGTRGTRTRAANERMSQQVGGGSLVSDEIGVSGCDGQGHGQSGECLLNRPCRFWSGEHYPRGQALAGVIWVVAACIVNKQMSVDG